jgi:hypothetical protein
MVMDHNMVAKSVTQTLYDGNKIHHTLFIMVYVIVASNHELPGARAVCVCVCVW